MYRPERRPASKYHFQEVIKKTLNVSLSKGEIIEMIYLIFKLCSGA